MTRWFKRFLPRLQEQFNLVAGVVAIGAFLLALAGALSEGTPRKLLIGGSAFVVIAMVCIGVVRAWPPKMLRVRDVEGKELVVQDLQSIDPRVPALGVVGVGGVGKTTLEARLLQKPSQDEPSTQRVTIHVSAVLRDPTTYLALVDGPGGTYRQQFDVADNSDIIILLLDHDDIPGQSKPNEDRLRSHQQFGYQMRDWLSNHSRWRGPVHILLNKRDLWEGADDGERKALRAFFADEVTEWRAAFGDGVTSAEHSNDSPNDIAHLLERIKQQWESLAVGRK